MLGFFAYWRELFRLLRNAPVNPMVRYGIPWRMGMGPKLFALLQIVGALLFVGWMDFSIYQSTEFGDLQIYGGALENAIDVSLAGVFIYGGVSFALNLMVYSQRWNDPGRLEELYLTPMEPREMAIGSIFWAVLLSFIPIAIIFTNVSVLTLIQVMHTWREVADQSAGLNVYQIIQRMGFILAAWGFVICVMCGTLKAWLYNVKHRAVVMLTGPLAGVSYTLFGFFIVAVTTTFFWDSLGLRSDTWYIVLGGAFATPYLVAITRNTGKLASSLFIRPVNMDVYIEYSVLANEGLRYYRKELRKTVRVALKKFVPMPWKETAIAVVAGSFLTACALLFRFSIFQDFIFPGIRVHCFLLAASTLVLLFLVVRKHGGRIPLVSGAPVTSIMRIYLPLYACFVVYTALFGFDEIVRDIRSYYFALDVLLASIYFIIIHAIILTIQVVIIALFVPRTKLRYAGSAVYFVLVLIVLFTPADGSDFWEFNASEMMEMAILLTIIVLLFNMMGIFQRMFEKEILHLPIGEANVTEPARQITPASIEI